MRKWFGHRGCRTPHVGDPCSSPVVPPGAVTSEIRLLEAESGLPQGGRWLSLRYFALTAALVSSTRSPLNDGWRTRPSRVHAVNSTSRQARLGPSALGVWPGARRQWEARRHDGAAKRNTPAGADGAGIDQPRLLWPMRSDMEGFKSEIPSAATRAMSSMPRHRRRLA